MEVTYGSYKEYSKGLEQVIQMLHHQMMVKASVSMLQQFGSSLLKC